jgi:hypothetical protein
LDVLHQELGDRIPPFIIITANYDTLPCGSHSTPGISEIFPKPIPFKDLQKTIARLLSSSIAR